MPNYQKEKFVELLTLYKLNQQSQVEHEWDAWDSMYKNGTACTNIYKYGSFLCPLMTTNTCINGYSTSVRGQIKVDCTMREERSLRRSVSSLIATPSARKRAKQIMQWDTMYEQLAEFSRSHGHCMVPCNYEANLSLGHWVKNNVLISI
jgi:hypothetical protein